MLRAARPALVIARFTLLEALRNRLLWLVFAFVLLGAGLAEFIGAVAITETRQFQSGFLGAVLRLCAVFTLSLFVITSMVREFNDKGLELVLSLPVPRASYFLGKLAGFGAIALLTALLCSGCLLVYAPAGQVALWGASLSCELLIVTAFSLLCLFTFSQVTLAISTVMAFYVAARSMAAIQLISREPIVGSVALSHRVIEHLLDALAFVLPDLYRFTRSEWLVYHVGTPSDLLPILGQSAVYLVLICGAALFDLYRKSL